MKLVLQKTQYISMGLIDVVRECISGSFYGVILHAVDGVENAAFYSLVNIIDREIFEFYRSFYMSRAKGEVNEPR